MIDPDKVRGAALGFERIAGLVQQAAEAVDLLPEVPEADVVARHRIKAAVVLARELLPFLEALA